MATAADGVEGLGVLRATRVVCFVVVDLFMPRMDGFGLLRAIASDPRLAEVPLCLSTSAPLGVACLPKPIDPAQLFAKIDLHCPMNAAAVAV